MSRSVCPGGNDWGPYCTWQWLLLCKTQWHNNLIPLSWQFHLIKMAQSCKSILDVIFIGNIHYCPQCNLMISQQFAMLLENTLLNIKHTKYFSVFADKYGILKFCSHFHSMNGMLHVNYMPISLYLFIVMRFISLTIHVRGIWKT